MRKGTTAGSVIATKGAPLIAGAVEVIWAHDAHERTARQRRQIGVGRLVGKNRELV